MVRDTNPNDGTIAGPGGTERSVDSDLDTDDINDDGTIDRTGGDPGATGDDGADAPFPDEPGGQNTIAGPDAPNNPLDEPAIIDRDDPNPGAAGADGTPRGPPDQDLRRGMDRINGGTQVDPGVADDPGSAEAAQDAAAGDSLDATRNELARVTGVDPGVEDTVGSAEAAQDAAAAGALGEPTTIDEDSAEGAQDLAASGAGVNPRRGTDELIGGSGAVEDQVRRGQSASRRLSRALGRGAVGVTDPQVEVDGDELDQLLSQGFVDEPAISVTPREAPEGAPRERVEETGRVAGGVIFGTVPNAARLGIEGGEAAAFLANGGDPDRVARAAEAVGRRSVVEPARETFFVRDDTVDALATDVRQGRAPALDADRPGFGVEPEARDEVEGAVLGNIAGAAAVAPASTAVTPVRVARTRIPTDDGGTTTVRTAQTRLPGRFGGRNLAGQATGRPEVGTPSLDPDVVDFRRLGGRDDRAFEPSGQLETDTFRATARAEGGQPAERSAAQRDVLDEVDDAGSVGTVEADSAEDLVGAAERVPDDRADDVAAALRDLDDDAVVFGSAATNAQLPEFRSPNDLDVVVRDRAEAEARFAEALEGSDATVGDVFDLKEVDEAPGKFRGGEPIKFGRTSRDPVEFDGIRINSLTEETVRKTGAAGFFRGRGAPEGADDPRALPDQFDVGPQPRRAGRVDTRQKDVDDAITLARGLDAVDDRTAERFAEAFGRTPDTDVRRGVFDDVLGGERDALRRFADDDRGQTTLAARATGARDRDTLDDLVGDRDNGRQVADDLVDGRRPRDSDRSPSPQRSPDTDTGTRLPGFAPSSPGGSPDEEIDRLIGGSPTASPEQDRDPDSPLSPFASPPGDDGGGFGSPFGGAPSSPGGGPPVLFGSPPDPPSGSPPGTPTSPPSTPPGSPPGAPPGTPTTPPATPPREPEDEEENRDDSLFEPFGADETFGTGIFTPGEDDPDFGGFPSADGSTLDDLF